jgi:hypothetical protein
MGWQLLFALEVVSLYPFCDTVKSYMANAGAGLCLDVEHQVNGLNVRIVVF